MRPTIEARGETPDFVIEVLGKANFEEAGDLLATVNSGFEPLQRHLGISRQSIRSFWKLGFAELMGQRLSMVVRDKGTGRLVGFRLARDLASNYSTSGRLVRRICRALDHNRRWARMIAPEILIKGAPIARLMEYSETRWLHEQSDPQSLIRPRKVVEMYGMGMHADYCGRDLPALMTEHTHTIARELGYRHAIVQCTNTISEHIFRVKLGYNVRIEVDYESFEFNQRPVFSGVVGRDGSTPEPKLTLLDHALT